MQDENFNLIGISGKAGSGKDIVGKIIQKTLTNQQNELWEIKKFAYKLKLISSILTGIDIKNFEDQSFKETELGPQWNTNPAGKIGTVWACPMTVRQLLQKLGTDALRHNLHRNVWINALFADYVYNSKWIITDVRFKNEYESIKNKGGILIRVNRPGYGTSMKALANDHISETELDGYDFDYTIENNGSLEDLVFKVNNIIK